MKANEYELDMYNEDMNIERNPGIHDGLGCCNHALGFFEQAIIGAVINSFLWTSFNWLVLDKLAFLFIFHIYFHL